MKLRNSDIFILIEFRIETPISRDFLKYFNTELNWQLQSAARIIKILKQHLHSPVLFAALHIFSQTTWISSTVQFDSRPVKPLLPENTKAKCYTNKTNKCCFIPRKNQDLSANEQIESFAFSIVIFCLQKCKCFDCWVGFLPKMTINLLSGPINQANDTLGKAKLNDTK